MEAFTPHEGSLKAANRAAAVTQARAEKCGSARGHDAGCNVSEAEIQNQMPPGKKGQ